MAALALALAPTAFAPPAMAARPHVARAGVSMAVTDMPGVSTETGNKVWDPLGLADNMDEGNLRLMRAAELKHGRVAMLATVGWVWTATGTHFEGMLSTSSGISFADAAAAGNPLAAATMVPGMGIFQMVLAIGALEVIWENKYPGATCAGNFGVPPVTRDPTKLKELETIELKHGRLAMIGIISFASAVGVPGSVPFYPF